MNATQTELATLAALVGITPDTHRHLFNHRLHCCECGSASRLANGSTWVCSNDSCPAFDYGFFGAKGYKQAQRLVADLPPLDTPAGDDVYLAPLLRWLHLRFDAVSFAWVQEELICLLTIRDGNKFVGDPCIGFSRVSPLLRACQSAGVPEIVEIFGKGE